MRSRGWLLNDDDWMLRGACRELPGSLFYPVDEFGRDSSNDPAATAVARTVCAECTVRRECLEYALVTYQSWGIWGGLNERERLELRRRRRREATASA